MQKQKHLKPVTAVENSTKRNQCIGFGIKYIFKSTVQRRLMEYTRKYLLLDVEYNQTTLVNTSSS